MLIVCCQECQHHTVGLNCERCAHGYYGDAQRETPTDCKRCACPLETASNNFSPSCEPDGDNYVCTQCPQGYQGRHCEELVATVIMLFMFQNMICMC